MIDFELNFEFIFVNMYMDFSYVFGYFIVFMDNFIFLVVSYIFDGKKDWNFY